MTSRWKAAAERILSWCAFVVLTMVLAAGIYAIAGMVSTGLGLR